MDSKLVTFLNHIDAAQQPACPVHCDEASSSPHAPCPGNLALLGIMVRIFAVALCMVAG